MKTTNIKVVWHYDTEDEDCTGDYFSVDIFMNNKFAVSYGDHYHDKGAEKVEGFIDALKHLGHDIAYHEDHLNDGEY